jgi:hypothetical protein
MKPDGPTLQNTSLKSNKYANQCVIVVQNLYRRADGQTIILTVVYLSRKDLSLNSSSVTKDLIGLSIGGALH